MKKNLSFCILLLSLNLIMFSLTNMIKLEKEKIYTENLKNKLKEISDNSLPVQGDTFLVNPPDEENNLYWEYIKEDFLNVNFSELLLRNKDTVAWLKVGGTSIDYPVVQTDNNDFYLNHSFDKTKSIAGWIFSDFRNNLDYLNNNSVIYGHRRLDMSMFGSLISVLDKSYFENKSNHVIKLSTAHTNMLWQVVSIYTIPKETYYITTHFTEEEYPKFLDTILARSIYDFNVKLTADDKILTLSTCQDNLGMRIVLHAKLIKKETK